MCINPTHRSCPGFLHFCFWPIPFYSPSGSENDLERCKLIMLFSCLKSFSVCWEKDQIPYTGPTRTYVIYPLSSSPASAHATLFFTPRAAAMWAYLQFLQFIHSTNTSLSSYAVARLQKCTKQTKTCGAYILVKGYNN